MASYNNLPVNVTVILPPDRSPNGIYSLPPGWIHIHPFDIHENTALEVPIMQLPRGQSLSVRARVCGDILGTSEFFRFHPGTGGIAHVFYDENISSVPEGIEGPLTYNYFNGMTSQFKAIPVPFPIGDYFYHVMNLENQEVAYRIGFTNTNPSPEPDDKCAPFK